MADGRDPKYICLNGLGLNKLCGLFIDLAPKLTPQIKEELLEIIEITLDDGGDSAAILKHIDGVAFGVDYFDTPALNALKRNGIENATRIKLDGLLFIEIETKAARFFIDQSNADANALDALSESLILGLDSRAKRLCLAENYYLVDQWDGKAWQAFEKARADDSAARILGRYNFREIGDIIGLNTPLADTRGRRRVESMGNERLYASGFVGLVMAGATYFLIETTLTLF